MACLSFWQAFLSILGTKLISLVFSLFFSQKRGLSVSLLTKIRSGIQGRSWSRELQSLYLFNRYNFERRFSLGLGDPTLLGDSLAPLLASPFASLRQNLLFSLSHLRRRSPLSIPLFAKVQSPSRREPWGEHCKSLLEEELQPTLDEYAFLSPSLLQERSLLLSPAFETVVINLLSGVFTFPEPLRFSLPPFHPLAGILSWTAEGRWLDPTFNLLGFRERVETWNPPSRASLERRKVEQGNFPWRSPLSGLRAFDLIPSVRIEGLSSGAVAEIAPAFLFADLLGQIGAFETVFPWRFQGTVYLPDGAAPYDPSLDPNAFLVEGFWLQQSPSSSEEGEAYLQAVVSEKIDPLLQADTFLLRIEPLDAKLWEPRRGKVVVTLPYNQSHSTRDAAYLHSLRKQFFRLPDGASQGDTSFFVSCFSLPSSRACGSEAYFLPTPPFSLSCLFGPQGETVALDITAVTDQETQVELTLSAPLSLSLAVGTIAVVSLPDQKRFSLSQAAGLGDTSLFASEGWGAGRIRGAWRSEDSGELLWLKSTSWQAKRLIRKADFGDSSLFIDSLFSTTPSFVRVSGLGLSYGVFAVTAQVSIAEGGALLLLSLPLGAAIPLLVDEVWIEAVATLAGETEIKLGSPLTLAIASGTDLVFQDLRGNGLGANDTCPAAVLVGNSTWEEDPPLAPQGGWNGPYLHQGGLLRPGIVLAGETWRASVVAEVHPESRLSWGWIETDIDERMSNLQEALPAFFQGKLVRRFWLPVWRAETFASLSDVSSWILDPRNTEETPYPLIIGSEGRRTSSNFFDADRLWFWGRDQGRLLVSGIQRRHFQGEAIRLALSHIQVTESSLVTAGQAFQTSGKARRLLLNLSTEDRTLLLEDVTPLGGGKVRLHVEGRQTLGPVEPIVLTNGGSDWTDLLSSITVTGLESTRAFPFGFFLPFWVEGSQIAQLLRRGLAASVSLEVLAQDNHKVRRDIWTGERA